MGVTLGASNTLSFTLADLSAPLTLSLWFRVANTTGMHTLASKGGGIQVLARGDVSGDPVQARNFDSGLEDYVAINTSNSYSANAWQHACVMMPGGSPSASVYCNGTGKTTGSIGDAGNSPLVLGSSDCDIAEVGYWNTALTDAEIAILALGLSPLLVRPQGLFHYLPLVRSVMDVMRGATITGSPAAVVDHPRMIYGGSQRITEPGLVSEVLKSAANSLLFSQNGDTTEVAKTISQSFTFSQSALNPFVELAAANSLAFSQADTPWQDVRHALLFSQNAVTPEVVRAIEQSISFRQLVRARTGNLASGRYRR